MSVGGTKASFATEARLLRQRPTERPTEGLTERPIERPTDRLTEEANDRRQTDRPKVYGGDKRLTDRPTTYNLLLLLDFTYVINAALNLCSFTER